MEDRSVAARTMSRDSTFCRALVSRVLIINAYPWFVETLSDGATTRLSAVERARVWMVDVATPFERALIARKLKDADSTTFIHGASMFVQSERPQTKTFPASDADKAASKHPPKYYRQVFLTKREAASFIRIGVHKLERIQAAGEAPACCKFGRGLLCACRSADLGVDTAMNARESN